MAEISQKIFCAFCRLQRKVVVKKHSDWTNVALSLMASGILMFFIWRAVDPRAIIFFVICIFIAEIFIHLRWRMNMSCPHCGFDPLLYKSDREAVVRKVKNKLAQVRANGQYLLKQNNPFENLPCIKAEIDAGHKKINPKKQSGQYLSREA